MIEKIRAAIQGGHSSVINGIDTSKATKLVNDLFKQELSNLLDELEEWNNQIHMLEDEYTTTAWARIDDVIDELRSKYEI